MKHTQGEWINLGYRIDVEIADGLSGICEMSEWMEEEEMEANCKLMAAAPELLEALQELIGYTKATLKEHGIPFFDDLGETCNNAILKATE